MSDPKDESRQPGADREIPQEEVRHPETLYDRSDLSARGIIIFLILLAITGLVIALISWGLMRYFAGQQLAAVPRATAIVTPAAPKGDPTLRFPAPVLQPDPVADLNKFRARLEEHLNTYGWVDQNAGIVHIPIDKAIDLVGQIGLPTRPQPPALPPHATFGSGDGSIAGAGGGTEPRSHQ